MKALIKQLTDAYGPSGYEEAVRAVIQAEVTPHVDSVEVDALGNLHAVKRSSDGNRTLMLAAHMDEVGLVVTEVEKNGFVRFTNIGDLHPLKLPGARVVFENGAIGMINIEDAFFKSNIKAGFANLYIDMGTSRKEDCPVGVGDMGVFFGPTVEIGNRMMSKSMAGRIGCVVQIETLKRVKDNPHDIHFVFTVQKEVGLRGAKSGAFKVNPDIAIAIDVTPSGDPPGDKSLTVVLGKGPAIKVMDRGNLSHPAVKDWMVETAEVNNTPYQLEVLIKGSTDAASMQLAQSGAAVGSVSIPCRHIRTPSEIVDLEDVENAINLLVFMLSNTTPDALDSFGNNLAI